MYGLIVQLSKYCFVALRPLPISHSSSSSSYRAHEYKTSSCRPSAYRKGKNFPIFVY